MYVGQKRTPQRSDSGIEAEMPWLWHLFNCFANSLALLNSYTEKCAELNFQRHKIHDQFLRNWNWNGTKIEQQHWTSRIKNWPCFRNWKGQTWNGNWVAVLNGLFKIEFINFNARFYKWQCLLMNMKLRLRQQQHMSSWYITSTRWISE